MQNIFLTIPYPPSVNNYWGFNGHRRYLTQKAQNFKANVAEIAKNYPKLGKARLEIKISLFPDSKRKADIDNRIKSCLDAMAQAQLFDDDSQIDRLFVERCPIVEGGKAEIQINCL